jgi:hypothetical protein
MIERSLRAPPMSPHGPSRDFAAAQQFGRLWNQADIN